MKTMSTALIAIALIAPAPFALAQGMSGEQLTREQAVEIVTRQGMAQVKEIELDGGEWEVEGCSADGRELEIDLHSRTGDILKYDLDRDKDDDCAVAAR